MSLRPDIRDVPCKSCQNGYGEKHRCDWPDWCPCDQHGRHVTPAPASEPAATGPQTVVQPTGGTPPPPAPARASDGGFEWPCDRRYAHERHNVANNEAMTKEQVSALIRSGDWPHCIGVKAHPTTMIGGGYDG